MSETEETNNSNKSISDITYTGQNNLSDLLKDYFKPENEDEQYIVIKKKRNDTTGLVIHDTENLLFKKELNIGTTTPPPPPNDCPQGKEYSQTYKKCIPICNNNETYDPNTDKCVPTTPDLEVPLNNLMANVTASSDDGNIATNVFDGKPDTRWSSNGQGNWLDLLLTKIVKLKRIGIAFYKGNTRQTSFVIGGNNFRSNGTTDQIQMFNLTSDVIDQKIRIIFNGNTRNNWNSVTEIQLFGQIIGDPNPPPDQHILKSIIFARNIGSGGQTPSNLDAQFSSAITEANPNDRIVLDGTSSTPLNEIENWNIKQVDTDIEKVTLEDVLEGGSTVKLKKQFVFPDTNNSFNFELEIGNAAGQKDTSSTKVKRKVDQTPTCPAGQIYDHTQGKCVPDDTQPPQNPNDPVDAVWHYTSKPTLDTKTGKVPSSENVDEVMLPSGASGAKNHQIVNKRLVIDTGGGNGRIYWDYHRVNNKAVEKLPNFGYDGVFGSKFILNGENLSIKVGNHGSDGREYDGKYVFGGFGFSLHANECQSKQEYYHNVQGKEVSQKYPNGLTLKKGQEYEWFARVKGDPNTKETTLNVWVKFESNGNFIPVMTNRVWKKADWKPTGVPQGKIDTKEIEAAPYIKCHTVWTRANTGSSTVWDMRYGIPK